MAGNLKKFINLRFIKTIDLRLTSTLLARHKDKLNNFDLSVLNEEEPDAREALGVFLTGSGENYPEGLRADLLRVAELGDKSGLEIIQAQADRHGVDLFPELKVGDEEPWRRSKACCLPRRKKRITPICMTKLYFLACPDFTSYTHS